jgi:NAD(P)-dependent dehydrogenase (short-subunit alcohol dehydrogenase family)
MSGQLAGKAVLITGGASGIGRAAAAACAREGARLVLADVDEAGGRATAEKLAANGAVAHFVRADVTRDADVKALVERAVALLGRLDCAFNNAGIEGAVAPIPDYPGDTFARVLDVNVQGVYRCLREELPVMQRQGGGAIVNTASVAGLIGAGGLSAYIASKHAVIGLTKVAALENARQKVRVNAVCPGVIQTPMLDRLGDMAGGLVEGVTAVTPMGRVGTPEEIAEAVVWLFSDASSFVTGHALTVDGGFVVP